MLTLHGVSYLVGDGEDAQRDLEVIARELHCDTVMLICDDVPRLIAAARAALDLGLGVHLRPDATDKSQSRMLKMLDAVASAAESLRLDHPDRVTLLVGSELSHAVPGIVPGLRSFLRLRLIIRHHRLLRRRIDKRLNRLLTRAAAVARRRFNGPVAYAAAGWEAPDWSLFDLVCMSLYRTARNRDTYTSRLRSLVRDSGDKPVVVSEFGCGAFTGADERGAGSFQIVNWLADPPRIRGEHPRDEAVQARYLTDLIDLYDTEGVHGCFVFTFVMPDFPHKDDPSLDLDKAGFGLLAVGDDGTRRRKAAFNAVADRFRSIRHSQ